MFAVICEQLSLFALTKIEKSDGIGREIREEVRLINKLSPIIVNGSIRKSKGRSGHMSY